MTDRTQPTDSSHNGHGGHGWMMIACCIPMLTIAIFLAFTGVASPGFLFTAIACTAMMALMMRFMNHDTNDEVRQDHVVPSGDHDRHHHPSS